MNHPQKEERQVIIDLLGDLAGHIDCAMVEEYMDDVLCEGCKESTQRAMEWLDENDKDWREKRTTKFKDGKLV